MYLLFTEVFVAIAEAKHLTQKSMDIGMQA